VVAYTITYETDSSEYRKEYLSGGTEGGPMGFKRLNPFVCKFDVKRDAERVMDEVIRTNMTSDRTPGGLLKIETIYVKKEK
jgi:hypothetical protein